MASMPCPTCQFPVHHDDQELLTCERCGHQWTNGFAEEPPCLDRGDVVDVDLSERRVASHVTRVIINGVVTTFVVCFLVLSGMKFNLAEMGALQLIALVVGWLFAAALLRGLQALLWARPHFRITRAGLDLRYWNPGVWPMNQLLPWLGVVEHRIPWSDLKGCRTYTRSSNRGADWKTLLLDTSNGTYEIGSDIFATDIDKMQEIVLDYHEREIRRPARRIAREAAPRIAEEDLPGSPAVSRSEAPADLAGRFTTPVEVHWVGRRNRGAIIALSVLLSGALLATGAAVLVLPSMACFGLPFVSILALGLGLSIASTHYGASGKRLLRLTDAGIEMGDGPENLKTIPWDQIDFVRIDYLTVNNAPLNKLRIHLREGPPIELPDTYDHSLEALADLIDRE